MSAKAARHRCATIDRGTVHVHRYTAACSCGWVGVHRRHRGDADAIWRSHAASESLRQRPDRRGLAPRPPTPVHLLPEALRPTVVPWPR